MKVKNSIFKNSRLDKTGVICSGVCAIHCLFLPVFTLSFPAISSYFKHELIHIGLLFLIIPIAAVSLIRDKKNHQNSKPIKIGSLGVFLLIFALLCEQMPLSNSKMLEILFTVLGSFLLIFAHLSNIKFLNRSIG